MLLGIYRECNCGVSKKDLEFTEEELAQLEDNGVFTNRDRSQMEEQVAWCWLTIKHRWRGGRQNVWDDLPIHMSPVMKSHLWLPQSFQLWSGEMEISSVWWPLLPAILFWDENGSLLFFTILLCNPPSLQIFLSWIITYSNKFKTEGSTSFLPGIWCIKKKSWGNGC